MTPLRLGIVTTSYPRTTHDPAGSFVAGLARWLRRAGHTVEVVAAGPGDAQDGDIPVERVPGAGLFYDEGAPERLSRSWRARVVAPTFAARFTARVLAASRRWDAVVSHWLAPSGLAAALTRRPHLAVAHSGDVHLLARPGLADAAALALLAGGPLTVAFAGDHLRARFLAALSGPSARALAMRSLACPMGLDLALFASLRPATHAAPHGTPLVAFLGRLVPIKGVDTLIDACARLPRASLVIAGAGPEKPRLKAHAREVAARAPGLSVRFAGELRGSARDHLFAAADVLALPSIDLPSGRTEGTPVTALEALAAGLPLVASDVGGVRDAVGMGALIVPPGDVDALAEALRDTLSDHDATRARVAAGRRLAARFDWAHVGRVLWDALPLRDPSGRAASRPRNVSPTSSDVGPAT